MGASPSLKAPTAPKMVAVANINADGYQRAFDDSVSQRIIMGIAQGWDWDVYDPIKLFRKPSGEYEVMDGQGRTAAAVLAGITHLPAVVLTDKKYAKVENRAGLFLTTNRGRRPLNRYSDWNAAVKAGEQWALDMDRITTAHGLTVGVRANTNVVAAGEVTYVIKRKGSALLDEAFATLVEAWPVPTPRGATHGRLIIGLAHFIGDAQTHGVWDRAAFVKQAKRLDPVADVHREARITAASLGCSDRSSMAWAVAFRTLTRGWRTLVIRPQF